MGGPGGPCPPPYFGLLKIQFWEQVKTRSRIDKTTDNDGKKNNYVQT